MKKCCFLVLYFFFLPIYTYGQVYPKNFFRSPVDIKVAIAGTFGELRKNHFHSGIDIKTKQKINIPIYAIQDGYVSRIKVSSFGFGKTVYINHENGFTSVYAHLENFADIIEMRAQEEHYKKEKFEINFHLPKNEIKIKKGELIGFSGNTGSSTAPHLHFEIRDTKTQKIINPMLFGFPILDITHPVINSILIYHKNGTKEVLKTEKIKSGTYQIFEDVEIKDFFNIGVNTVDFLDAAPNKCGVYSIELYVNDTIFFRNKMESFSFNETKYINSHIDYEYYINNGVKFQKCFLEKNNKLSTNQTIKYDYIGTSLKEGRHNIKIIVKDSYLNSTSLTFQVNLTKENLEIKKEKPKDYINSQQVFEFKNDDIEIYIPNNSLYKDYPFGYQKDIDSLLTYPIYKIFDDSIPSHKPFIISIKIDSLKSDLRRKAIIVRLENDKMNYIKSKWQENKIIGQSNNFGKFTILIDSIKPIITIEEISNDFILVKIKDELSGIKKYRGEIDGKWVLMEYDFKTDILKYKRENERKNKNQILNLSVTDKVGNTQNLDIHFKND